MITSDAESLYSLHNLPYGIFSWATEPARVGVRFGDRVLDLVAALPDYAAVLSAPVINPLLALGPEAWRSIRAQIQHLLTHQPQEMRPHLHDLDAVQLHLPFAVADYVDFYSNEHHARNVGLMFRPDQPPLNPNWKHLPVGYHGRSGTVVVSGTDVVRPYGQRKAADEPGPTYGPSQRLDIEAEVGFVVGVPSRMGQPVSSGDFAEHVFGVVLVNDWSARDIQAWEYVPLGPFLGKSFATSVSPWVVPLEALQSARLPAPAQDPPPLPYLRDDDGWALDIDLEVRVNHTVVSRPPFSSMYWTPAQQLAHLTANGAALRTGDLFASGTVSGPAADQRGSLLELAWNGSEPIVLADGGRRSFLADGDEVRISATAAGPDGARIGMGDVVGSIRGGRRSGSPPPDR